jgi:2,5-diketo-D-gluconate reductase A
MNLPSTSLTGVPLHDGTSIPGIGFGTYGVHDPAVVAEAIAAGHRHIDTAQMYGNEEAVGQGIRDSGIAREELYVTTKLHNPYHLADDARREFAASLDKLGLEQVDLFLIHWPMPTEYDGDFVSTWRTLVEFAADGRARSIGVSNFLPEHLDRLVDETGVVPVVNQVEVHPWFPNAAARAANARHGVVTVAWSPIARGALLEQAAMTEIASEVGRTPGQVVLRWHLQSGTVPIPKSTNPARMRENLEVTDFELTAEQVARIDALDRGEEGRTGADPATMAWMG